MIEGFDLDAMDPAYTLRLLRGIEAPEESVFASVFEPEQMELMSGKVPYIPSRYTVIGDDANYPTRVAIDDVPYKLNMSLDNVQFSFDGKHAFEFEIHKKDVRTLQNQGLEGAEDLVQLLGMHAMAIANQAYDLEGASVLQDASLNATTSATSGWDPSNNTDFFADMYALEDVVGKIDVVWLGRDEARKARELPEVRERAGHSFEASNASRVGPGVLAQLIMDEVGAEEVIIDGTSWKNTANQQQTISKQRIFDGTVWAGQRDHLMAMKREDLDDADTEENRKAGTFSTWIAQHREIARAENNRGCILTGT